MNEWLTLSPMLLLMPYAVEQAWVTGLQSAKGVGRLGRAKFGRLALAVVGRLIGRPIEGVG
jgi:hypothetical protein